MFSRKKPEGDQWVKEGTGNVTCLTVDHFTTAPKNFKYPVTLDFSDKRFQLTHLSILDQVKDSALKEVNVSNCRLQGLSELNRHVTLKTIKASRNQMQLGIGVCLKVHRLSTLELDSNKLTAIPPLSEVPLLQVLNLARNQIHTGWEELQSVKGLRGLDISRNRLSWDVPSGEYNQAMGKLKSLKKLRALDMQGNPVAEVQGYRSWVIANASKVEVLDEVAVTDSERKGKMQQAPPPSAQATKDAAEISIGMLAGKKERKKSRLFGVDLDELLEQEGGNVPQLVEKCTKYLQAKGLGNKNALTADGSPELVLQLRNGFEEGITEGDQVLKACKSIAAIGSFLRAYLMDLPKPPVPVDLFLRYLECSQLPTKRAQRRNLAAMVADTPMTYQVLLEHLCHFLVKAAKPLVANDPEVYKALGRVWGPCILRAPAKIKGQYPGNVTETIVYCIEQLLWYYTYDLYGGEPAQESDEEAQEDEEQGNEHKGPGPGPQARKDKDTDKDKGGQSDGSASSGMMQSSDDSDSEVDAKAKAAKGRSQSAQKNEIPGKGSQREDRQRERGSSNSDTDTDAEASTATTTKVQPVKDFEEELDMEEMNVADIWRDPDVVKSEKEKKREEAERRRKQEELDRMLMMDMEAQAFEVTQSEQDKDERGGAHTTDKGKGKDKDKGKGKGKDKDKDKHEDKDKDQGKTSNMQARIQNTLRKSDGKPEGPAKDGPPKGSPMNSSSDSEGSVSPSQVTPVHKQRQDSSDDKADTNMPAPTYSEEKGGAKKQREKEREKARQREKEKEKQKKQRAKEKAKEKRAKEKAREKKAKAKKASKKKQQDSNSSGSSDLSSDTETDTEEEDSDSQASDNSDAQSSSKKPAKRDSSLRASQIAQIREKMDASTRLAGKEVDNVSVSSYGDDMRDQLKGLGGVGTFSLSPRSSSGASIQGSGHGWRGGGGGRGESGFDSGSVTGDSGSQAGDSMHSSPQASPRDHSSRDHRQQDHRQQDHRQHDHRQHGSESLDARTQADIRAALAANAHNFPQPPPQSVQSMPYDQPHSHRQSASQPPQAPPGQQQMYHPHHPPPHQMPAPQQYPPHAHLEHLEDTQSVTSHSVASSTSRSSSRRDGRRDTSQPHQPHQLADGKGHGEAGGADAVPADGNGAFGGRASSVFSAIGGLFTPREMDTSSHTSHTSKHSQAPSQVLDFTGDDMDGGMDSMLVPTDARGDWADDVDVYSHSSRASMPPQMQRLASAPGPAFHGDHATGMSTSNAEALKWMKEAQRWKQQAQKAASDKAAMVLKLNEAKEQIESSNRTAERWKSEHQNLNQEVTSLSKQQFKKFATENKDLKKKLEATKEESVRRKREVDSVRSELVEKERRLHQEQMANLETKAQLKDVERWQQEASQSKQELMTARLELQQLQAQPKMQAGDGRSSEGLEEAKDEAKKWKREAKTFAAKVEQLINDHQAKEAQHTEELQGWQSFKQEVQKELKTKTRESMRLTAENTKLKNEGGSSLGGSGDSARWQQRCQELEREHKESLARSARQVEDKTWALEEALKGKRKVEKELEKVKEERKALFARLDHLQRAVADFG